MLVDPAEELAARPPRPRRLTSPWVGTGRRVVRAFRTAGGPAERGASRIRVDGHDEAVARRTAGECAQRNTATSAQASSQSTTSTRLLSLPGWWPTSAAHTPGSAWSRGPVGGAEAVAVLAGAGLPDWLREAVQDYLGRIPAGECARARRASPCAGPVRGRPVPADQRALGLLDLREPVRGWGSGTSGLINDFEPRSRPGGTAVPNSACVRSGRARGWARNQGGDRTGDRTRRGRAGAGAEGWVPIPGEGGHARAARPRPRRGAGSPGAARTAWSSWWPSTCCPGRGCARLHRALALVHGTDAPALSASDIVTRMAGTLCARGRRGVLRHARRLRRERRPDPRRAGRCLLGGGVLPRIVDSWSDSAFATGSSAIAR